MGKKKKEGGINYFTLDNHHAFLWILQLLSSPLEYLWSHYKHLEPKERYF